jgi:hypothetical protein
MCGSDPNGLRAECEAALPETIEAENDAAAEKTIYRLFDDWVADWRKNIGPQPGDAFLCFNVFAVLTA